MNCKDEYSAPNTTNIDYEQWNNDAIVYSLFNSASSQSSLRKIEYKNKIWDIKNNFFFMSNEQLRLIADNAGFLSCYQDAKQFPDDRYVWNVLKTTTLSKDAEEVLAAARVMVCKSMAVRRLYHESHPEYHLNSWDAGWSQMKPMFKEHFADDLKAFIAQYKAFEARMREGVYEFGFLKK